MADILLKEYGFLTPQAGIAKTITEAGDIAQSIGYPVALKIVSPEIVHKLDVGGIALHLNTPEEVADAYQRISQSISKHAPEANIDGILVQEMIDVGHEIVLGLSIDPQFGPNILFGIGGSLIELLQDVSLRVLPIHEADAEGMIEDIKGKELLNGYRGLPKVSRSMLVDLILQTAKMGMDLAPRLEAVDFNPIKVWDDNHRVLDAKILLRDQSEPLPEIKPNTNHLEKFFEAKSVAVVGASGTAGKIGNAVMDSLVRHEYKGKVYPINPSRKEIMGIKTHPSISSLPESVDVVVATISLAQTPKIIDECAAMDIHNLVVISGGGKELGGDSKVLEEEIARLSKEKDVRIIGPNCIGTFDGMSRLDNFFQVHERMVRPPAGPIAIFTQSGTVGAAILEKAVRLGVSKFVSFGNRVDVDESDLIEFVAEDPQTQVITCYVEGLADGRKFIQAASKVTRKKPVIVFKAGRSERGARASISHTGFFGGSHTLFKGAMKQASVITVESIEELFAAAKALVMQPQANGPRMAMISNGAGTMVQAMDLMEQYALTMEDLEEATILALQDIYPPYFIVQNPIDVTGSATSADYRIGIEALLNDPNVDIVMPWFVFQDTPLDEKIIQVLGELSDSYQKPILCGAMGGPYTMRMVTAIEGRGVPVFTSVREWVAAAKAVAPPS
jgi:3-hydroxypropionyl-CoA synthetase (ADP-forming)